MRQIEDFLNFCEVRISGTLDRLGEVVFYSDNVVKTIFIRNSYLGIVDILIEESVLDTVDPNLLVGDEITCVIDIRRDSNSYYPQIWLREIL
ncbi:TPA: hypothetical protein RRU80_003277 [Klebsiella variicola]|nr:hypothetical protein [Klebsiella variicola]